MTKRKRGFLQKTRRNSANKEARQKARTKKHFSSLGHTVVTLPAGATITVIGTMTKELHKFAQLSTVRKGTLVKANVDLIMTVDGNGLVNRICHKILFCRPDEKSSGKKVFLPKSYTYNEYDIRTMNWSGEKPIHIPGGHTAALLYRGEFLVPCPKKSGYFWITNRILLKQLANVIKRQPAQAA